MRIKDILRGFLPAAVWRTLSVGKRRFRETLDAKRSLRSKFTDIYNTDVWRQPGEKQLKYYSGRGSDDEFTRRYVEVVSDFIRQNRIRTVLDIGCGDFRVGRQLISSNPGISYTGVDIVEPLIQHNTESYGNLAGVRFLCLNAVRDPLPDAELVLIRQVLQHLSNKNISTILHKLRKYRWILASDAVLPTSTPCSNDDMRDGHVVRERGLFLEKEPFNQECTCLLITSVRKPNSDFVFEDVRTVLIQHTS